MSSENRKLRSQDVRDLAENQHGLITSDELAWAGVPPSTRRRWCLEGRLVRLAPSDDLADFEVVEREGIPCADATRSLIDLGAVIESPTWSKRSSRRSGDG